MNKKNNNELFINNGLNKIIEENVVSFHMPGHKNLSENHRCKEKFKAWKSSYTGRVYRKLCRYIFTNGKIK